MEFYLDAFSDDDQSCDVIQRWRPWASTWNGNLKQAIDNNVSNGNDRFQIANLGDNVNQVGTLWLVCEEAPEI